MQLVMVSHFSRLWFSKAKEYWGINPVFSGFPVTEQRVFTSFLAPCQTLPAPHEHRKKSTKEVWLLLECVLWWGGVLVCMCVCPPKIHVGILTPKGGGVSRWGLREVIRWDRALMNGINVIRKETPQSSSAPFTMWGCKEKPETWKRAFTRPC